MTVRRVREGAKLHKAQKEKVAVGEIYKPTGERLEHGFNATFGDYRFTEEDVKRLLEGEEITISLKRYDGAGYYEAIGSLVQKLSEAGNLYWTFSFGIPKKTFGHTWTDEERKYLYDGEILIIDDFYSKKKDKVFEGYARYDKDEERIKVFFELEEDDEKAFFLSDKKEEEEERWQEDDE